MAIIQNRSTEIGDVLFIKADIPIIGLIALSSFTDSTTNETGSRLFAKKFRYSVDGINYSPWLDLTDQNLASIVVQSNDTFYAEYSYQRIGSDPSEELVFNSVTIDGEYDTPIDGPAYEVSNFSNYFDLNNVCSIAWSVNVLEKLYKKGILPNYIDRDFSGNNVDDRDFIDTWRAVTHYFALFVCLARKFQFFYQDSTLLLEYLVQKGYFVRNDFDYNDLLYLMSNYYDEIRQRGTRAVFLPKNHISSSKINKPIDGEYLRTICYSLLDEFIYNLNRNEHIGFNIGNSSPLYKGLEGRLNTNKYYCDFIDDIHTVNELSISSGSLPFVSIVKDYTLDDQSISVSESTSGGNASAKVIQINPVGLGNAFGLGKGDKRIIVNPHLDYEVTFFIKANGSTTPKFTFGVDCWDKNDNIVSLLNIETLTSDTTFLTQKSLNKANRYYFVRGIIYNKNNYKTYNAGQSYKVGTVVLVSGSYYRAKRIVPINTNPIFNPLYWQSLTLSEVQNVFKTNLGGGNNLVFDEKIIKIDPFILFDDNVGSVSNFYIYDIRVQPLSTEYSKGFLSVTNFLELWSTNNNLSLSEVKINNFIRKYLIPMNIVLENNFVESELTT